MHGTEQPAANRSRLSAADWERAALTMIADEGVGALAIDPLARRLGVTKGSFYWHFRSREALMDAALARWEQHIDRHVLEQRTDVADPRDRLRQLFRRAANEVQSTRVHAAMLRALERPRVHLAIEHAAQRHLGILTDAYRQAGMPAATATHRARLAYAAYVGFLQLSSTPGPPRLSREQFDAYVEHVVETLVPRT